MSNNKERERISFRLRLVDGDLREATKGLTSDRLSDLARDGLRLILGITATKRVEVVERPIVASESKVPHTLRSKSAVYVPNQRTGGGQRGTTEMLRN